MPYRHRSSGDSVLVRAQRLVVRGIALIGAVVLGFWLLVQLIKLMSGVPL